MMDATQAAKEIIKYFNIEPAWKPGESASDISEVVKIIQQVTNAQLQAIATAARTLFKNMSADEIEIAREVWGNTNTRIILEARQELAAALAALKGGE